MNTPTLQDIRACFEGAIPAVVATCAADGTPNVAYISQVFYAGERHVALSFQFFNKTRQNILANPHATALLLHPATAQFYRLHIRYLRTETEGPLFEGTLDRLAEIVDRARAKHVFVTWERDPHCDHEAAAAMARALRRRRPGLGLWFYPIWGWHLHAETPLAAPAPKGCRIDISPWLAAKHAAIRAHASQMTDLIDDDPGGFRFDERTLAPFLQPSEYYFEVPA